MGLKTFISYQECCIFIHVGISRTPPESRAEQGLVFVLATSDYSMKVGHSQVDLYSTLVHFLSVFFLFCFFDHQVI